MCTGPYQKMTKTVFSTIFHVAMKISWPREYEGIKYKINRLSKANRDILRTHTGLNYLQLHLFILVFYRFFISKGNIVKLY